MIKSNHTLISPNFSLEALRKSKLAGSLSTLITIFSIFQFIWLIIGRKIFFRNNLLIYYLIKSFSLFLSGAIWVYSARNSVSFDPTDLTNYCNYTCYYFAFGTITGLFCLVALACLLGCMCSVCGVIFCANT